MTQILIFSNVLSEVLL